jgi:hypothetical protein
VMVPRPARRPSASWVSVKARSRAVAVSTRVRAWPAARRVRPAGPTA